MTTKERHLSHILEQLEGFLLENTILSNRWIENTAIRVYIRKTERSVSSIREKSLTCLDIANIFVGERYRQQRYFTDFVIRAHELHSFEMTYLESVRNPLLIQWCLKRGWAPDYYHADYPNFFALKQINAQTTRDDLLRRLQQENEILQSALEVAAHKVLYLQGLLGASSEKQGIP